MNRYLLLISFLMCMIMPLRGKSVAVIGLGGRAHYLLLECLAQDNSLHVVAVCDDAGKKSYEWFARNLSEKGSSLYVPYKKAFAKTRYYEDSFEALTTLCTDYPHIDAILICSQNDRHYAHLEGVLAHSPCKTIYMEKPLFTTMAEYTSFYESVAPRIQDRSVYIGLTLRYANMTHIVSDKIKEHAPRLGALTRMKSWEHLSFAHGFTIIMMNWRRYKDMSGGFLFEKSIHDLDLALFFMHQLGNECADIAISSHAEHRLYKKSHKQKLLSLFQEHAQLTDIIEGWQQVPFKRLIEMKRTKKGNIAWKQTLDEFFAAFPEDSALDTSNIIPDYQTLHADIKTTAGATIAYELEVDMSTIRGDSSRGIYAEFEHGRILIDIMRSELIVQFEDKTYRRYDLQTGGSFHAGGDAYIAQLILGTLPKDRYRATINDDIVQLATCIGLASEAQVSVSQPGQVHVHKNDQGNWVETANISV